MVERNLSERYRLEHRIGQGGMAVVYSGVDTVLRRRVAIKVLREHLAADVDFVQRFYIEAQHAAKLSHPNIVNIYDVGREGENYFIVMELVDGTTLGEMIEKDGALPEPVAIDFAAQICSGLAYAHRQGLMHRDVKPANILITKDDVVKISDFGIARGERATRVTEPPPPPRPSVQMRASRPTIREAAPLTLTGVVMGTPLYMAPETIDGAREATPAVDLFAVGVIAYELLTGRAPFRDSPAFAQLEGVSVAPPPPLATLRDDIPWDIAQVVERCLAFAAEERPTAREVLAVLSGTGPSRTLVAAASPL